MKKYVVVPVLAAVMVLLLISGGASATPSPQPRKACSSYDREHFHGVTAHLPDGVKCLQVEEWCSRSAEMQRGYREYGFVCKADGRLAKT